MAKQSTKQTFCCRRNASCPHKGGRAKRAIEAAGPAEAAPQHAHFVRRLPREAELRATELLARHILPPQRRASEARDRSSRVSRSCAPARALCASAAARSGTAGVGRYRLCSSGRITARRAWTNPSAVIGLSFARRAPQGLHRLQRHQEGLGPP
jgi:hypothetical protein